MLSKIKIILSISYHKKILYSIACILQQNFYYTLVYNGFEVISLKITVYADVLFVVNFVINYLLLYITAMLCKTHLKHIKTGISSAIGAIYAVVMFVPNVHFAATLLAKIALSLVMVYVAFGSIKYFKHLCFFYAVSLISAGVVTAFVYSGSPYVYSNGGVVYINAGIHTIVIAAIVSYCIIRIAFGAYKKYSLRDYLQVVVLKDGKAAKLTVLVDTGNLLCDPIQGSPVIVAEQYALRGIIGGGDVFEKAQQIDGVRLIPFSTIQSDNGLLVGFKPDKICCKTPLRDDIIIAVTPKKFNAEYNALAGPHSFAD